MLESYISRTITVSEELYSRLQAEARIRGFNSIEQLLEQWQASGAQPLYRKEVIREIDDLRERLFAKYGEMPDSVELLSEDRER